MLAAAEELLAEGGLERLSVGRLSERSGVHHASIYRRWGSVEGVVVDLAAERVMRESPIPDTGTLRGDLLAYARTAAASIAGPDGLNLLKGVILATAGTGTSGATSPLLDRGSEIQAMLDRADARGEPALRFTQVIDHLLAPIYFRRIFGIGGVDEALLGDLVDRLLAPGSPS